MALRELAEIVEGKVHGKDVNMTGVSIDTRRIQPGDLFVALRGERYDGHDFLLQAKALRACGAMVSRPVPEVLPQVVVADTGFGLQRLAGRWRERFSIPLVGVTGSNGKTTVKEMIGAILSQEAEILVTEGNLNNHIGLPLTLCRLRAHHRYAVIEMGMNHPGEIDLLTRLALPTVALITNAAPAHLEGVGSVEAVARAKAEIFHGLADSGVAVINADDSNADLWRRRAAGHRIIEFGLGRDADVRADYELASFGSGLQLKIGWQAVEVALPLPGLHNVRNALAAAAVAHALSIPLAQIRAGLESVRAVSGRLTRLPGCGRAVVLDDSYNANPGSVQAALAVLAQCSGKRVFVLGDMAELGDQERELHAAVGAAARAEGVEALFALGDLAAAAADAFGPGGRRFQDRESLIEALTGAMDSATTVLVKGSRRMAMDRVVEAIVLPARDPG